MTEIKTLISGILLASTYIRSTLYSNLLKAVTVVKTIWCRACFQIERVSIYLLTESKGREYV